MNLPDEIAAFRPPGDGEGAVFAEPWQAQAFALTLALHERGVFSWREWAKALSAELSRTRIASDGCDYYAAWLRALEVMLRQRNIAGLEEVDSVAEAWMRAAHATPHGKPILLENDPGRPR